MNTDPRIEVNCRWLKGAADQLSGTQFRCIMAIGAYVDPWGLAWPATSRLADQLQVTTRQVRKVLQALRAHDLLYSFPKSQCPTCHAVNRMAISFGPPPQGYMWDHDLLIDVAATRCKAWTRTTYRPTHPRLGLLTTEELCRSAGIPTPPYDGNPDRLAEWQAHCLTQLPAAYRRYLALKAANKAERERPPTPK